MKLIFLLAFCIPLALSGQKAPMLKYSAKQTLKNISEPSDVCLSADKQHLYIVSDDGILFETDLHGAVIRSVKGNLTDAEGVYADAAYIYVADEFSRNIELFRTADLSYVRSVHVSSNAARNSAFEAITWDPHRHLFYLFTEKNPITLVMLSEDMRETGRRDLLFRGDISAACFHKGKLWLLNDEEMEVMRVDPETFAVEMKWRVPVINPEGLAFLPDGKMIIISDDLGKMYVFPDPEMINTEKR